MNNLVLRLRQKYPGTRRDIYGEEYSTVYTSLVDAIHAHDKDVYQPIFDSNEYVPINWDLIPFATYLANAPDNLNGNYPPTHRLSIYGRACTMYLYKGDIDYGFDPELPIKALKPYANNDLLQVITIPESYRWAVSKRLLVDDPMAAQSLEGLDGESRYNVSSGYISLYLNHHDEVFNTRSQTWEGWGPRYKDHVDQAVQEYRDEMEGLMPDIYTTIPDVYQEYSQYYPLPVYDLNIGLILHLDRPDLLDYRYGNMSRVRLSQMIDDYLIENNRYADVPVQIGTAIQQYLNQH